MRLTKNFSLSEFNCADGTKVPAALRGNAKYLAEQLQVIRDTINENLHVNSGYRTITYNAKVGGKPNSFHLKAMAADIICKNYTPKQLKTVIEKLIKEKKIKIGGVGLYPGFLHIDTRAGYARW
jgi:uncharacterized protein YcbK (DUF882 family)